MPSATFSMGLPLATEHHHLLHDGGDGDGDGDDGSAES